MNAIAEFGNGFAQTFNTIAADPVTAIGGLGVLATMGGIYAGAHKKNIFKGAAGSIAIFMGVIASINIMTAGAMMINPELATELGKPASYPLGSALFQGLVSYVSGRQAFKPKGT
jgi:hypothetical protein